MWKETKDTKHFSTLFLLFLWLNPNILPSSASLGFKHALWASEEQNLKRPRKAWANPVGFPVICKIAFHSKKHPGRWKTELVFSATGSGWRHMSFFLKTDVYSLMTFFFFLAQKRNLIKCFFLIRSSHWDFYRAEKLLEGSYVGELFKSLVLVGLSIHFSS